MKRNVSPVLVICVSSLLAGCGGGNMGQSVGGPFGTDFNFGNLGGRAAISNPPINTNSSTVTATGLTGSITSLFLTETSINLAETKIAFT